MVFLIILVAIIFLVLFLWLFVFRNRGSGKHEAYNEISSIPKIIHQTWKSEFLPESYKLWSSTFRDLNPDWEMILWTDEDNRNFIQTYYPWFLPVYDGYDVNIKRVDAIRYFLLYHYGGVYVDMDFACLKGLDTFIPEYDTYVIFGYQYDKNLPGAIANAFMASPPKHPLFKMIIHSLEKTKDKQVLEATGPNFLTEQIAMYKKPDIKVFDMPLIYTQTYNDKNLCTSLEEVRVRFPNSYTTHFYTGSWLGNAVPHSAGFALRNLEYKIPKRIKSKEQDDYYQLIPKTIIKILITDSGELPLIPEYLFECFKSWTQLNPEYDIITLDKRDCEEFLQQNFPVEVYTAFQKLKPYAYQCDLVRLCWLYVYGGVYSDFRMTLKTPLREIIDSNIGFIAPNDRVISKGTFPLANGFIASVPKHPFLETSIKVIVKNIYNNYYGNTPVDPTGPVALGLGVSYVVQNDKPFIPGRYVWNDLRYEIIEHPGDVIKQGDRVIIQSKPKEDRFDKDIKTGNVYWKMWDNKDIYNSPS